MRVAVLASLKHVYWEKNRKRKQENGLGLLPLEGVGRCLRLRGLSFHTSSPRPATDLGAEHGRGKEEQ